MRFVRSLSRYAFQPFQKLARLAFGAYSFSTSLYSLKTFSTLEFLSARRCIRLQLVPRWNELRVGYFHYHRHFRVPTVSRTRPPCVRRVLFQHVAVFGNQIFHIGIFDFVAPSVATRSAFQPFQELSCLAFGAYFNFCGVVVGLQS